MAKKHRRNREGLVNDTPSIADSVWYRTPAAAAKHPTFKPSGTFAAIVVNVLAEGTLNLTVFDGSGGVHAVPAVPFVQDGATPPATGHYAQWVPVIDGEAPTLGADTVTTDI